MITTQTLQFKFQQSKDLLQQLTALSPDRQSGYWRFQFDTLQQRTSPIYWYLGMINRRIYCSSASRWSVKSLSRTLDRYVPQGQQAEIKAYLNGLHQAGLSMTIPVGTVISTILANGWLPEWKLEAIFRMKILVDMDTYLSLGSGQAEFLPDSKLASDLTLKGSAVDDLSKVALERQVNWQQFKQYLPSMNLIPVLNLEQFDQANLNSSQRQWIEQQVQRKLPLHRIAAGLGQDPMVLAKTFAQLVRANIIRLVPQDQLPTSTVMVIDDSPLVLRQFQQWLNVLGYPMILCQQAEQAISTIKQSRPSLIFIDINMPQISGFDLVKQIRMDSEISKIPIVILTAEQKLSNKWRAQWSNCEFLTKPLSTEEVAEFPPQLKALIQRILSLETLSLQVEAS